MANNNLMLCMNIATGAVTQWSNKPFNSFACIDGDYYACGDTGIFKMEQSTGETVDALVVLPKTDLGYSTTKAIRAVIVSGQSAGTIAISITSDDGVTEEREFTLQGDMGQHQEKVYFSPKITCGRFFQIAFADRSGVDFSIDRVEVIFMVVGTGR